MHVILTKEDINEHIDLSISKIDNEIDLFMKSELGWNLVRIEILTIEAYTYQRAFGGSYISTPKKLANTKCTINSDNSQTGDNMCLKYALGAYFVSNRGENKNLQCLSVLQPYLDIVNLDRIPMPTSICPYIIKSKDNKYRQKNHFLWIKNINGLVFKDTAHYEENATQEFVKRIDKELIQINRICKDKFNTDNKDKKTSIPVVFHNFWGYDSHLVCESVGKSVNAHQIKVITKTFKCYKSIKDRFLETELPPIHEFHSTLKGKISQDDYHHAQKYYELDPSHYVSALALAWDAMLKMMKVKIELFTDMSMHDFIEDAKHGGIAIASHQYFKANNPKIDKAFNPSKPTTWISYVNANNLYGWAMSQYLPIGNYK
ncbi:12847_t:CDS:2 [Cetraspora pellucida]|uniref:12847_t:CDS:1 n=1 Tax=Cetraspora pellucida TaxID=1433469 RepID=A0ACA9N9N8_9GLOM|nr:12847_t:CDS:2 [Cetraspora pellucida]